VYDAGVLWLSTKQIELGFAVGVTTDSSYFVLEGVQVCSWKGVLHGKWCWIWAALGSCYTILAVAEV